MSRCVVACCGLALVVLTSIDAASPGTIRRDRYGIPHILARTEAEAAFLHGYAMAEDHLELMARLYRRAQSRQSEFFGPEFVEEDFYFKRLEVQEKAARALAVLPPAMRKIVERFAAGHNAVLRRRGAQAPAHAQPIGAVDVLAHCYAVLLADYGIAPPSDRLPVDRTSPASNMWALGRAKTVSGRGILLVNPHLQWTGPFTLHEVHIRVPGRLDVYGVSSVGAPVVTMGFTPRLGWAHTVNRPDVSDVYRLTLNEDKTKYLYDNEWRPLRSKTVAIKVWTADGVREESRELSWSHHGPVMRTSGTTAHALKTAVDDAGLFLVQWHAMAKAASLAEFRAALDIQGLPMFNVGYADRDGHVFFLSGGRIPVRPSGYDWSGIVPGDTSKTEWSGIHANRDLPQKLNPTIGYLQNSNEPPWYLNRGDAIASDGFPPYVAPGGLTPRAQISLDLLESRQRFTLHDVIAAKFDARSFVAARLKPELVAALRAEAADEANAAVLVLESWNATMAVDSRGGVLFQAWWQDYSRKARPIYAGPSAEPRLGDRVQAVRSMSTAVEQLGTRTIALDAAWGDLFRFQRGDADLPLSGCEFVLGCFRAMMFRPGANGKQAAYYGDSFIMAVEFEDTPRALAVLAYSQSSNPASHHFNDQGRLFAAGQLREIWFTEAQIAANLESTLSPDTRH